MSLVGRRGPHRWWRASLPARRVLRSSRAWALAATVVVVTLGALVLAPAALHLDEIQRLAQHPPASTAFMDARRAAGGDRLDHVWVDYDRIAPVLARAVIVAEDARFVDHRGIDWDALSRAFRRNWRADGIVRGGSTITQQLAKNLFLSERRNYLRKAQEAVLAVALEAVLDKRRILEIYLNVIEWGENLFGAEAAARHYYGVSAARLSVLQAVRLAARIPRPRYYDRVGTTDYLRQRAAQIEAWLPYARLPGPRSP